MLPLLIDRQSELRELCRKYQVRRLEIFGSAADEPFDPQTSDLDFLVEYESTADLGPWMDRYFQFQEELSLLLGKKVDLVETSALKNPFFIQEVNRTRTILYERKDT
ncbi:MAG: nucleotidyltransferase domain-containing protein [Coprothermobacterota bacterium]|nr:nucleotidyltransferase domain-containing protein [Coprothermobacterota bacterium]